MKITVDRILEGEDEVILRYREMTQEVERILKVLRADEKRLIGRQGKEQVVLNAKKVLYLESVDEVTFAYTKNGVYRIDYTLAEAEARFGMEGFFRCSKSMVINIWKVASLKSMSCNRIDATMENGEHVIISRTYAAEFRRILKGGRTDE
ncbi:MAG: LytTR family transcriptional regulator [Lachnospiraceae bacterium]|nr:LytTR family transcriptional regulator [Lachnospiraceae bacterium]